MFQPNLRERRLSGPMDLCELLLTFPLTESIRHVWQYERLLTPFFIPMPIRALLDHLCKLEPALVQTDWGNLNRDKLFRNRNYLLLLTSLIELSNICTSIEVNPANCLRPFYPNGILQDFLCEITSSVIYTRNFSVILFCLIVSVTPMISSWHSCRHISVSG
jgi:hypothetical protein